MIGWKMERRLPALRELFQKYVMHSEGIISQTVVVLPA